MEQYGELSIDHFIPWRFVLHNEICKLASEHIGQEVVHKRFQEVGFKESFDGIWASASLLYVLGGKNVDNWRCKRRAW